MPKRSRVWIFDASSLAGGLDGLFSLEYHLHGSRLKVPPESLIDSRLWLVVRDGDRFYLYAVLMPAMLQLYREGTYKGDFLLHTNAFGCVRFLPRKEQKMPWQLSDTFDGVEGVRECSQDEEAEFLRAITNNYRVGFSSPPGAIKVSIPKTRLDDIARAAADQLALTLRAIAFGDIWRPQTAPRSVSAIGSLALESLLEAHPEFDPEKAAELVGSLDPLSSDPANPLKELPRISDAFADLPPMVDTFLQKLDPESIAPRSFVASASSYASDWLDKTNDAEEAHEAILKTLAVRLLDSGFAISKSRSFDLFAEKSDTRVLFEVKSATKANVAAQGEKGIVQLLRYASALSGKEFGNIEFCIVLQDTHQPETAMHLSKMAQRAGLDLLLFDGEKDWPSRISDARAQTRPWF